VQVRRGEAPSVKKELVDILHISHFFPVFNPQFGLFFNNKKKPKSNETYVHPNKIYCTFAASPRENPEVFRSVRVDEELGTIVWENGADIDPDVLYGAYVPAWMEVSETTVSTWGCLRGRVKNCYNSPPDFSPRRVGNEMRPAGCPLTHRSLVDRLLKRRRLFAGLVIFGCKLRLGSARVMLCYCSRAMACDPEATWY
jgi:hypothetical protein